MTNQDVPLRDVNRRPVSTGVVGLVELFRHM